MITLSNICYSASQSLSDLVSFQNGGLIKSVKFSGTVLKLVDLKLKGWEFPPLFENAASDLETLWSLMMTREIINATPKFFKSPSTETFLGLSFCFLNLYELLKKNEIIPFKTLASLSQEVGGHPVLTYFKNIVTVPRNICIIVMSSQTIYNSFPARNGTKGEYCTQLIQACKDPKFICPLIASGGKLINLFLSPHKAYGKESVLAKVIAFVSSSATIFLHIYECQRKRKERANRPGFTAQAA